MPMGMTPDCRPSVCSVTPAKAGAYLCLYVGQVCLQTCHLLLGGSSLNRRVRRRTRPTQKKTSPPQSELLDIGQFMVEIIVISFLLLTSFSHAQSPFDRPAPADSIPKPPTDPGLLIFVYQPGLPPIYREALELSFTDGKDTITMEGLEFAPDEREPWPHPGTINTPANGNLTMWFSFVTPVGDTISSGRLDLPFLSGYVWRITFTCANRNPTMFCADCLGKQAFVIRDGFAKGPSDSVWVYWAGSEQGRGLLER